MKVALKVFEKKIKKAQELEAEEAKRRLEASASVKEQAHGWSNRWSLIFLESRKAGPIFLDLYFKFTAGPKSNSASSIQQ